MTVDTQAPSPFSASLLFGYVANYLYDGDAPLAERRAQALRRRPGAAARAARRGGAARAARPPGARPSWSWRCRAWTPRHRGARAPTGSTTCCCASATSRRTRSAARVGRSRAATPRRPRDAWLAALERERRVIARRRSRARSASPRPRTRAASATRSASPPPPGLPEAFLEPRPHALRELVARYARTHGPFHADDVARRFGVGEARRRRGPRRARCATAACSRASSGPGGRGREWCGADVLATLRRRSLAALRKRGRAGRARRRSRGCSWTGRASPPRAAHAPRPRRAARRRRAAAGRGASRLDPRARRPARAPPRLPARGPRRALRRGRGGLGRPRRRSASATAASRSSWPTTCRCLLPPRPEPPRGRASTTGSASTSRAHGASFFGEIHAAAGGGLARAGPRRALGPGLGGRGHERHARRRCAPSSPRARRARSAGARALGLPLAPAGPARAPSAAGACCRRRAGPRAPPSG